MTTDQLLRSLARGFSTIAIALSLAIAPGCGDDDDTFGPPDGGPRRDAGTDAGEGPPDGEVPPDAGGDECRGADGCWSCAPTTEEHLLNACTDFVGIPFDNRARITILRPDGSLPPLP